MHNKLLKTVLVVVTIAASLFVESWFVVWTMFFDGTVPFGIAMLIEIIGYVLTMVLLYITISLSDVPPLSIPHESFFIGFIGGIPMWYNDEDDEIKFGSS